MEDEPLVRIEIVKAIEVAGFKVAEAADADHAVRLFEKFAGRVRAIVADINLPGSMRVASLARHAGALRPGLGIIFTSGRSTPDLWALPKNMRLFQKPYPLDAFVKYIRETSSGE